MVSVHIQQPLVELPCTIIPYPIVSLLLTNRSATDNTTPPASSHSKLLGAELPPVLAKLVTRIESGAFIEIMDLLPERLGTYYYDKESMAQTKKPSVTNILE